MSDQTFFITTPIYYINATPHIGHAYTQIAADARARFERMRGKRVHFLTGTDENAIKIARVAREQGRDPQEFCDELAQQFRDVWDALNISYDDYLRTTEPRHTVVVQRVFEKLWQDGHLELSSYSGWYSVPDETFFPADKTVERDGAHFIAEPTEDQSKAPLEWVEETSHFFKLSGFETELLAEFQACPERLLPEARRNETLSFIRQGLRDTSISRVQDWGIPVPEAVPEHEGHVVYVWFPDALLNYASAPGYLSDDPERRAFFEQIWPPDLQLMSKDIFTRFHATLWPALLRALDLPLPKQLFAHGFWTVNGEKISKRHPHTVIEPVAFARLIAQKSGADFGTAVDALRYYSLREVTFGSDGDFSREGCLARYNSDLANGLGNLVNRALSMLQQYFGSVVPEADGDLVLRAACEAGHSVIEEAYENLDFSGALADIWRMISLSNRVIEEQKPWAKMKAGEKAEVAALLRELLGVCQWASIVLAPVMPHVCEKLRALLNLQEYSWAAAVDWNLLPPSHRCLAPQSLFPRIQNLQIEAPSKDVMESVEPVLPLENLPAPEAPAPTLPIEAPEAAPVEAPIEYSDFAKVQLRAGRVLEAERVPKADKLLRLQIDLGTEKRQILAGIAQQFEPESLIGKTVVVVANLAPRKLRGFESQGMLLAASAPNDDAPSGLVTIDADVPPGSIIR